LSGFTVWLGVFGFLVLLVFAIKASIMGVQLAAMVFLFVGLLMLLPYYYRNKKPIDLGGHSEITKYQEMRSTSELFENTRDLRACIHCEHVGRVEKESKGSCLLMIVLFLCFIVPGIIYMVWMLVNTGYRCPKCKTWGMIPLSTLRGREIYAKLPPDSQKKIKDYLASRL
jgi:hypothetical protein